MKMGENASKEHTQILELSIFLIKNILSIKGEITKNTAKSYKNKTQAKIYKIFSKRGGIFDSIIYCCIHSKELKLQKLNLCFMEIFYLVFSSFPAGFIFSENKESEYYREMKEREKALRRKRINNMSSRHSRFGKEAI